MLHSLLPGGNHLHHVFLAKDSEVVFCCMASHLPQCFTELAAALPYKYEHIMIRRWSIPLIMQNCCCPTLNSMSYSNNPKHVMIFLDRALSSFVVVSGEKQSNKTKTKPPNKQQQTNNKQTLFLRKTLC